jgi:outer membrane protein
MRKLLRALIPLLLLSLAAPAEQLPFRRAVELALSHSAGYEIAKADVAHAEYSYFEARNMFLPQMTLGSGLGYSNGFPLSLEGAAPSIINVNASQYVINAAQREFMRAARSDWAALEKVAGDRRAQVVLETATAYADLDTVSSALESLTQQQDAAAKLEQTVSQRVQAGIDSEVALTRARLASAHLHLQVEQLTARADLLRLQLSQLTGLPAREIATMPESMPRLPEAPVSDDTLDRALKSSLAVEAANKQAEAKEFRAKGEHKMLYPSLDFAGQYALLAEYNNYDAFFKTFQRHNGTVGVVIRFPFLNFAQRAHANAADAEALHARKEAEQVENTISTDVMKVQTSIPQLATARDIARLEHELAEADANTAHAHVEAGTAPLPEEQTARINAAQKYSDYLNAELDLDKAQLQLLRLTGDIESWALGKK